ncbi:RTC4-like domain-containing protein [Xylariales sp. AK1849]|nr:RTC4-like domain-containing protein [Xylariales sp. AK1849]
MSTVKNRSVGLSKNAKLQSSLLSNFRQPKKEDTPPTKLKLKEYEDVSAPPMSSDDEGYQKPTLSPRSESSDDSGKRPSADIKKTNFGKSTKSNAPSTTGTRKSTRVKAESPKGKDGVGNTQRVAPAISAGSKRSAEESNRPSASHLEDVMGFTRKRAKTFTGYGKGARNPSRKPSTPKSSALPEESPKKSRFKVHTMTSSPHKSADLKTADKYHSALDSSPINTPAKIKLHEDDLDSDDFPTKSKPRTARQLRLDNRDNREALPREDSQELTPKRPFKKYDIQDLGGPEELDDGEEVLSTQALGLLDTELYHCSLPDSDSSLSDVVSDDDLNMVKAKGACCPMCNEPVDPALLKKYSGGGRMNVKKQSAFCRAHKRSTAEDTWKLKGYPDIDWDELEPRFEKHQDILKDILQGTQPSHYATNFREKVESGMARTLLKENEHLTPGYYGPQGFKAMSDFIVNTLSDTLRKRAVEDRLVSARGHSGYVQAVLVPELAVRLIIEDMNVTEEEAREIMSESAELGEFLHEETSDVVMRGSDDED